MLVRRVPRLRRRPTAARKLGPGIGRAGVDRSSGPPQPPVARRPQAATVRLQLQWTPQAQFAGYFAADKQGYFEAENLTVDFLPGGPTVVPQQVGSEPDGPEFTISWVPKVLEAREARLGPRRHRPDLPALRHAVGDVEGHRPRRAVQARRQEGRRWDFGNEFEVTAGLLTTAP